MAIYSGEHKERYPELRHDHDAHPQEQRSAKLVTAGSVMEACGAVAAIILSILGLIGREPMIMFSAAVISLGAAFLVEALAVAGRYSRILYEIRETSQDNARLGGGVGTEIIGGIAAITLGVLAILGIEPVTLISSAVITLGVTAMLGSSTKERLSALDVHGRYGNERAVRAAHSAMLGGAGAQTMAGLAAVILGILALMGINPLILGMSAMLTLGAAILIASTAVSSKMAAMLAG